MNFREYFFDYFILLIISWPLAYGMAKVFGRFTLVLTLAVVMSLFVSENIRLFGWVLTLMKGGLIEGHWRYFTGVGFDSPLYGVPIIIFGLVYVYFPFMLFPLALMKDEFKLSETAVEQVVIRSNDDLMAFVDYILGRAADASFVRQIKEKTLRFELSEQLSMSANSCTDRNLDDKKHVSIEKILITERDIGKLDNSEKAINIYNLKIPKFL